MYYVFMEGFKFSGEQSLPGTDPGPILLASFGGGPNTGQLQ